MISGLETKIPHANGQLKACEPQLGSLCVSARSAQPQKEEGATCQGKGQSQEAGKNKETFFPLEPAERNAVLSSLNKSSASETCVRL